MVAVRVYGSEGTPVIEVRGASESWLFPLDSRQTLEVPGPLGITTVEIADGSVRVVDSPCSEKTCIKSGSISRPGQTIACLPNRVFVVIRGRAREEIDAFSF
ncbi:MAG: NusG domain II-containing protein [Spirochaetales bacterium]|nr:NusG domain II-containing protein [Spirochaetales bacterium]